MVCYHINEKLSTMGYGSIVHNPLGSSCSMTCYHINEKLSTMGYGSIFQNLLNLDLITNKIVNNRSTLSTVYVSIICRQQVGSECKHLLCKQAGKSLGGY
jgi:hypothetical protein